MPLNSRKSKKSKDQSDETAIQDTSPQDTSPVVEDTSAPSQITPVLFDSSVLGNQVEHGLAYPEFSPNDYFAGDLFADSSKLSRTTKGDADAAVAAIEEKRQTVRIVKANIGLNSDLVEVGNDFQKFIGNVIDYSTTKVNNQTKYTNFETAGVNQQVAGVKLSQALEKLTQEEIVLGGLTELTPLIREEWRQRKELKKSKIEDLKNAVYSANSKLDAQIQRIADTVSGDLVEA
jgi:hypothetical protein